MSAALKLSLKFVCTNDDFIMINWGEFIFNAQYIPVLILHIHRYKVGGHRIGIFPLMCVGLENYILLQFVLLFSFRGAQA